MNREEKYILTSQSRGLNLDDLDLGMGSIQCSFRSFLFGSYFFKSCVKNMNVTHKLS